MTRARTKRLHRIYAARLLLGIAAGLGCFGIASPVQAQFASAISLGSLTPATGMKIFGSELGEEVGGRVARGGDINGDGLDDVLVTAASASVGGAQSAGVVYVVFGTRQLPAAPLQVSDLDGKNGFRIAGKSAGDHTGIGLSGGGDINGDGFDDIVIGAPDTEQSGQSTGTAYIVFGKAGGFKPTLRLSSLNGNNGFRIEGQNGGDNLGQSVSLAEDINGDGLDEVMVGAFGSDANGDLSGSAFVVFGRKSGWDPRFKLGTLNGKNGFRLNGTTQGDFTGTAVSGAGDFNGDGFGDILIGSRNADIGGGVRRGTVHLMFGKAGGFSKSINVSSLTGAKGFRMDGVSSFDETGTALASAGDINGDGLDDIVIGAEDATAGGFSSGAAYVIFGSESAVASPLNLGTLDGLVGFRRHGNTNGDSTGASVGGATDVNGDGFLDALVGSRGFDLGVTNGGASHVLFGKSGAFAADTALATLPVSEGFRLDGEEVQDGVGAVSSAGDFNGDGFGDLIVGAGEAEPNGLYSAGKAYVVLGRAPDTFVIRQGSAAGQYISGGPESDILVGLGGNDSLEGRGGDIDTHAGGDGKDTTSYAHAPAGVIASLANNAANTGDATADVYVDIEGLEGSRFTDALTGDGFNNHLIGGLARDMLKGGKGKDHYRYAHVRESKPGSTKRDVIVGFNPGKASTAVDVIDLRNIDANAGKNGNQKFKFIGTAAFTGKGQLRLKKTEAGIIVQGNVKGGLAADFEILLKGQKSTAKVTAKDFKL